jgi:hypothetical protein
VRVEVLMDCFVLPIVVGRHGEASRLDGVHQCKVWA